MIFIPLKPIITKKYSVPRQQFTANQAVKFAAADIGIFRSTSLREARP